MTARIEHLVTSGPFGTPHARTAARTDTVSRRLVPLLIQDQQAVVMGHEPVYVNGRPSDT
ncbi:hypothetical protein [Streptomyces carpinensis]|uniref:hypothetical protein n=1 Tax=Streptomyces carpinensis TaxID=66369 RepID=UPI001FC9B5BC|nr:hypothetical protein [Streptomyces carpinensis]